MSRRHTCRNFIYRGAFALLAALSACEGEKTTVKTEIVKVDSLDQIIALEDSLVKPVIYTRLSGFEKLPHREAKSMFIAAVLPAILITKHNIEVTKRKIISMAEQKEWTTEDSAFYHQVLTRYRAKDITDLLGRMGTLPNSIVLAQAAVESGWGQSRFFVEANNLFGMWSVTKNERRIAAVRSRNKKTIWLRSYQDMSGSIVDYFTVLSRAPAYNNLRKARSKTSDPFKLIPHLKYYSEKRRVYTKQLETVIRQNNLTKYDSYIIDPEYLE